MGKKQLLKLIIRILVTVALLAAVLSRIDLQQLGSTIKNARWWLLVIVWALAVIAFWIRAIKMQVILRKQRCGVNIATLFRAGAVTTLYSLIMPGMLCTGVKWYILKKHTGKGTNVLSAMAYNQATDVVAKLLLGLVALIIANPTQSWHLPFLCVILTVVIIAVSVLLITEKTGPKFTSALNHTLKPLPQPVHAKAQTILNQIQTFQTAGWKFHRIIAVFNLTTSFLGILIFIFAAKAARITVPVGVLVWQTSAIYILAMLPISIANLGVREFTLVGTMALYGVALPDALLMSAIIFSNKIILAIIGVIYELFWVANAKKSTPQSSEPEP